MLNRITTWALGALLIFPLAACASSPSNKQVSQHPLLQPVSASAPVASAPTASNDSSQVQTITASPGDGGSGGQLASTAAAAPQTASASAPAAPVQPVQIPKTRLNKIDSALRFADSGIVSSTEVTNALYGTDFFGVEGYTLGRAGDVAVDPSEEVIFSTHAEDQHPFFADFAGHYSDVNDRIALFNAELKVLEPAGIDWSEWDKWMRRDNASLRGKAGAPCTHNVNGHACTDMAAHPERIRYLLDKKGQHTGVHSLDELQAALNAPFAELCEQHFISPSSDTPQAVQAAFIEAYGREKFGQSGWRSWNDLYTYVFQQHLDSEQGGLQMATFLSLVPHMQPLYASTSSTSSSGGFGGPAAAPGFIPPGPTATMMLDPYEQRERQLQLDKLEIRNARDRQNLAHDTTMDTLREENRAIRNQRLADRNNKFGLASLLGL